MITSLYSNKYLRVDNVWKESTLFLRNTVPEIARFILSHAKEYLAFYSLDNYLLFEWNKSEIIAPESVFIYFDEMDDFLNQITDHEWFDDIRYCKSLDTLHML